MPSFINKNGSWKTVVDGFINVNGSWKKILYGFINVAGAWKSFWSAGIVPEISQQVTISKSTNTNGTIKLTGKNYHWTNFSSGIYQFEKYNSAYTIWVTPEMDGGTITNPSIGAFNTKTYNVLQSDMYPNKQNEFRFSVVATSSSGNATTSSSDSVIFEMPRDITNLTINENTYTAVTNNYAITFTWTPSQYSGSQTIQYKQSSSSTWLNWVAVDGSTGSGGVGALNAGTSYDFRVLPWTGSAEDGYYGNFSNIITATTRTANKPGTPINLSASDITSNSLTFNWQANSSGGATTHYLWTYNTNGATPNSGNRVYSTSTPINGLNQSTLYYLWVAAGNDDGYSNWASIPVYTISAVITPGTPQNLSHTKDYSNGYISTSLEAISTSYKIQRWNYTADVNYYLTWSAATNALYYEISYNTSNSNTGTVWTTTSNTSLTASWGMLSIYSYTYYYWVRGVSSDGTRGSWSSGTGSNAVIPISTNASLRLYRCDNSAFSSHTSLLTDLGYEWTGVNTSYSHYGYISATVAGTSVSARSTGCVPYVPSITYGTCDYYASSSSYECSGTQNRDYTTYSYRRKIYIDGVWDGSSYDTSGCSSSTTYGSYQYTVGRCGYTESTSCTCYYSDYGSYYYSPQCCGSETTVSYTGAGSYSPNPRACCPTVYKTSKFNCTNYDVTNSASTNYYDCYSVGACTAPRNPAGTRTTCYVP